MASAETHEHANNGVQSGSNSYTNGQNVANARQWDYGGNPLAHVNSGDSARLPAFGGYAQPGLFKPPTKKIANPAPLGLAAFALTTFVLSLINWHTQDVTEANIVVSLAFGYGGLVQLLAGMWCVTDKPNCTIRMLLTRNREMAVGNTFGATALSSYGGFWISFAIVLTPGGFNIPGSYSDLQHFNFGFGFFLMVDLFQHS
jgi:succinate-acetate transporter protein